MTCEYCSREPLLGKQPKRCAFDSSGAFIADNWNCGTMNRLRDAIRAGLRDDMSAGSIGLVPIPWDINDPNGYIVLTYYKERGCTSGARICNDDMPDLSLTLDVATAVLKAIARNL